MREPPNRNSSGPEISVRAAGSPGPRSRKPAPFGVHAGRTGQAGGDASGNEDDLATGVPGRQLPKGRADLGERIVAYVVAQGVTERELIDAVAVELSVHKRPREVVFVDALPRNAMGKVRKDKLR